MRLDSNRFGNEEARSEREPGRSFQDKARPLGESLLDGAARTTAPTEENFRNRAKQAARQAAADPRGVAARAKVIGVLRKAEEFMSTANPPPSSPGEVRRALELASGRVGLTYPEYRALANRDAELLELERQVVEDALRRAGVSISGTREPTATVVETTEEIAVVSPLTSFARIFVPVDFSMACHRAVEMALALRRLHGSEVCLYHAIESSGSDDWLGGIGAPVGSDWLEEGEGRVRRFLDNIAPDAGPGIEVRVQIGFSVRTLCKEARRWGATMVITRADPRPSFFGSNTERILRAVGLPVLILPP